MTTPATRLFTVSRVIGHTLSLVGSAQATDAADAVRVALGLTRRPALDHSGPDGSGYAVGRRRYVAAAVPLTAPTCEVCGETHAVTPADRIGDRGEQVDAAEAMMVAHYRLSIAATSAAPFALHGGRAV